MIPVLYVSPTSVHGGAEEVLLRIMEATAEAGYQPHLLLPGPGWLEERAGAAGYPTHRLPTLPDPFRVTTAGEQLRHLLGNGLAVSALARRIGARLVHSNSARIGYHGGLGARLAGIPAVTHCHDIIGLPLRNPLQRFVHGRLARLWIVPSRATLGAVAALAPRLATRTRVVYNGWDRELYAGVQPLDLQAEFGLAADAEVVGCVAAMYPWKGQDVLIEAVGRLVASRPRLHLLVVGSGQGSTEQAAFEEAVHRQVREAGLESRVTFTGWRSDAWAIIRSMAVFCHLPTGADPLPTSVIHALALGRPVVGSRVGGVPEILADGRAGRLVEPRDPAGAAAAIVDLLDDPDEARRLGAAGQEQFERLFSATEMRRRLLAAYTECGVPPA